MYTWLHNLCESNLRYYRRYEIYRCVDIYVTCVENTLLRL